MSALIKELQRHQQQLRACAACPQMVGPVIVGNPVPSSVYLVGQAPGVKEGEFGKPFAWTAGKTLFKWIASIGIEEAEFRQKVFMAAVCRCFPGKNPKGGDRVPNKQEIKQCSQWMNRELDLLQPQLLIPVGKLAIAHFMPVNKLVDIIGKQHRMDINGQQMDVIPLPHPSGLSTWFRTEPGKTLLEQALHLIQQHPAWQSL